MSELDIAVMCKREDFEYTLYCAYVDDLYEPERVYKPIGEEEYNRIQLQ